MHHGPTLDELRELSRRSRRAQRWAFAGMVVLLALYPAQLALAPWAPAWALVYGGAVVGGALVAWAAFVAGEERGAFRRVFRRIKEEKKRTRTLVPEGPEAPAAVEAGAPVAR